MHFTGHALIHTLQSLHVLSTFALSFLASARAHTGQRLTHPPHPVHNCVSILIISHLLPAVHYQVPVAPEFGYLHLLQR